MSTIQQPIKRVNAGDQSESETRPARKSSKWANIFYGMGSVLELFPSGEIGHPADPENPEEPEDALTIAAENLNRAMSIAFERLVSQYEETVPMPVAPKQLVLLSPELFEKYKQIVPDFPERWLAMFEEEVERQHELKVRELEMKARELEAQFSERRFGQIYGFAIGLAALLAGSLTAVNGAEWAGLGIGGGGVIGLVSVFVLGKRNK